jgi:MFS family permease
MPTSPLPNLHRLPHLLGYAVLPLGLQAIQATNGTFLAPLLAGIGTDPFWISVILSLDPITCLLVMPWLNRWSDLIGTRWGQRLPFIVAGVLVSVASLAWIAAAGSAARIAVGMVCLYVGTSAIWGPYRASLGEIVPMERHTTATGLIGLCQGLGSLMAMGGGGLLLAYGPATPYGLSAVMLLLCGVVSVAMMARVVPAPAKPRPAMGFAAFFRQTRDLHWLLAAQTCWWAAMSGVIAFAVLFVTRDLLGSSVATGNGSTAATQQAVGVLLLFAVVTMAAALPTGRLAARHGKTRVLRWGLVLLLLGLAITGLATDMLMLRTGIVCAGLGFAAVQVIPIALFAELQPPGHEGSVMSLLGMFTDGPLLIGYLIEGWLITQTGSYRVPYLLGAVMIAAAWFCIGRMRQTGQLVVVREV